MVLLSSIFALLIAFQIKHFIADYPLQGKYMLKKFLPGMEFFFPLLAHCSVHAVLTFLIALGFGATLKLSAIVAVIDLCLHFVMDRIKASPEMLGRFKPLTAKDYTELKKSNDDNQK